MPVHRISRIAAATLGISHLMVLMAGFFAPYDPSVQARDMPFAPPSRFHLRDAQGKLHVRPFVYRWVPTKATSGLYQEDRTTTYPVRFFCKGPKYVLLGPLTARVHFFETDSPAKIFLMGSDAFGRDQFSRFLYGGRISLLAGIFATGVSLVLGLMLGGLAGFYGGAVDDIIMRIAEVFLALPWLYLLFAVRAFLPLRIGPNDVFVLLIVVIGAVGWARPARIIRGVVLSVKERDYVLAARGFGASATYLFRRHVLPQLAGVTLTQAAVLVPGYVLAEVVLSFFGIGVSEPTPSWGNLLSNLRQYDVLASYWWMFLPAIGLILIFLAYHSLFSYYGYYFAQGAIMRKPTTRMSVAVPSI